MKTFKASWGLQGPYRTPKINFWISVKVLKSIFGSLWRSQNIFLDYFKGPKINFWTTSKVPKAMLGALWMSQNPVLDLCEGPEINFRITLKVPKSIFESLWRLEATKTTSNSFLDLHERPKIHFWIALKVPNSIFDHCHVPKNPLPNLWEWQRQDLLEEPHITITITTLLLLLLLQSFITPLELYNTVEGLGRVPFPSRWEPLKYH